ncbi:hypothetical protein C1634_025215 [Chryseobacterium viscerum]|uniref:HBL/NHE enterotoxin family protein n=2 Tax=Chryseobacterium viscerum TaxID=1037377 RepID=A0A316W9H0_9FLAO|nr:hypothetical protein C1634_025215 [Chryseobacterium viscerum]
MTELEQNLGKAQQLANDWLINKGPLVISQIPQNFISYSNSMQVVAENMKTATTKEQVTGYFKWLQKRIKDNPADTETLQGFVIGFSNSFKPYKTIIEKSLADAENDIKEDKAKAQVFIDKINKLYQDIAGETEKASHGMIGVATSGGSLSFALLSYGFTVATTVNPAIPVVSMVVAVGGLTYAAIVNAINSSKVVDNLREIKVLQGKLLIENQAIAILQNIKVMLQNVENSLLSVNTALDITPIWKSETEKISEVIDNMKNFSDMNFRTIPEIKTFSAAADAWSTIAQTAVNIQKSAIGMSNGGVLNLN